MKVEKPHLVPGSIETRAASTSQSRAAPGRRTTRPPTTPARSQGAPTTAASGGNSAESASPGAL